MPYSCLMAVLRDTPTLAHFDPEVVTYWTFQAGHGSRASIEVTTPLPISRRLSWGRIEIRDRFDARNAFVSLGGQLRAERVGDDAVLVLFHSAAPILRLSGHSQREDSLAQEVVAFFARLLPRLWTSPAMEERVARTPPEALWSAFLLDERDRLDRSMRAMEEPARAWGRVRAALRELARDRPDALAAGSMLLNELARLAPGREASAARSARALTDFA